MKEMHTIARIYEEPGITLSEIADIENKTRSCLSQRINKLEKKGLIQKIKSQDEYKKTNLFVTDHGRMVAEYHARLDERNYSRVMEHLNKWSEHEFEKYIELLSIVEDSVLADC
jgi:DNA-binding MarR family transcriptional regulator